MNGYALLYAQLYNRKIIANWEKNNMKFKVTCKQSCVWVLLYDSVLDAHVWCHNTVTYIRVRKYNLDVRNKNRLYHFFWSEFWKYWILQNPTFFLYKTILISLVLVAISYCLKDGWPLAYRVHSVNLKI